MPEPIRRPMLAGEPPDDLSALRYPIYVTPKLDGIRCTVITGRAMTRSLKPLPNDYVRLKLEDELGINGLDGELVLGQGTEQDFGDVQSAFMRKRGQPRFTYVIFDTWIKDGGYLDRVAHLRGYELPEWAVILEPVQVLNEDELAHAVAMHLASGYEGTMLRSGAGPYKQGRSTTNEGYLLKLKEFVDAEAVVIGMEEMLRNQNAPTTNALGLQERSSHKKGMARAGTMGKLVCRRPDGVEFRIGSGFTQAQRDELWQLGERLNGRLVKYRFQKRGAKVKPRIPTFIGFRHADDTDTDLM